MFYLSGKDFTKTNNPSNIIFHQCLQECLLWRGENPMDSERGIDYYAVFEGRKFFENELENVLEKYRKNFKDITIDKVITDVEQVTAYVTFTTMDNKSEQIDFSVSPTPL